MKIMSFIKFTAFAFAIIIQITLIGTRNVNYLIYGFNRHSGIIYILSPECSIKPTVYYKRNPSII